MAVPAPDLAVLRQLGERVRPLSAAAERVLPVPEALAGLLPLGGLGRGTTVATAGSAASSLALALAGPATMAGSWCAIVGVADLGLLAAAELGVDLGRTLVVADPGPAGWAPTVASLLDAVEVVLVRPGHAITPTTRRRLVARARDRGSVLVHVGGRVTVWAEAPDLTVTAGASRWEGIGEGHGRLRARQVEVAVAGRRGADRPRRASLWLPGPDGRIALASPAPSAATGEPATPAALREVG
ncbi:MAG: hypothetical protein KDB04_01270 [Acidimicrobiales bacterium]|nr:hypothetical protein [Acidimicrobiales bacterium]HRW38543.1 hypothetical protein [Aquihabitans sp.]